MVKTVLQEYMVKKIDGFMINGQRYKCQTTNGIWYKDVNGYNAQDKNKGYAGSFGPSNLRNHCIWCKKSRSCNILNIFFYFSM